MTPNNRTLPLAALLLAGAAVFTAPPAQAALAEAATFDEKVNNAQAILVGRVVKRESRFSDDRRQILTYTTFKVEKTLKGGTPQEVTIVTPGGKVGDVTQTTIGVPVFSEGTDNLIFVRDSKAGPTVLYFDQGAYDVVKDDRGDRLVVPVTSDAVLVDTQRGVAVAAEGPVSLRTFEGSIRAVESRSRHNRMAVMESRPRQGQRKPSIWTDIADNAWIIAVAVLGTIVATIPLIKRSQ